MSESNTELVRAGYEAFGRGDLDVVMQFPASH
jgi:ketosteroid isomerase-like protein